MSDFMKTETIAPENVVDKIEYHQNFKTYCGWKYHVNFPDKWILNEIQGTGRQCGNCVGTLENINGRATWRGIILGYCANCAQYVYKESRGSGFWEYGAEFRYEWDPTAYQTYLRNTDLQLLGDVEEYPMYTIENHMNAKNEVVEQLYSAEQYKNEFHYEEAEEEEHDEEAEKYSEYDSEYGYLTEEEDT